MSYFRYNLPYSVTLGPQIHSFLEYPPVPIRRIEDVMGTGYFVDAAGIRATTGNPTADALIKWGFWVGFGLLAYRMYRVLRYDEPFIQPAYKLPPAWQANPELSNEEYRKILATHGITDPPEEYEIIGARYVTGNDDWYILVEDRGWYWYDPRDREWKFLPLGPIQNAGGARVGEEMQRQCAWCKRVWRDGKWRYETPDPFIEISHGACEDCAEKIHAMLDRLEEDENYPKRNLGGVR